MVIWNGYFDAFFREHFGENAFYIVLEHCFWKNLPLNLFFKLYLFHIFLALKGALWPISDDRGNLIESCSRGGGKDLSYINSKPKTFASSFFLFFQQVDREGAIQRTKIQRPFWAAKGFNANLAQFQNFYHRVMLWLVTYTSALLRAQFSTCMEVHLKWFCVHKTRGQKIIIYEGLNGFASIKLKACVRYFLSIF